MIGREVDLDRDRRDPVHPVGVDAVEQPRRRQQLRLAVAGQGHPVLRWAVQPCCARDRGPSTARSDLPRRRLASGTIAAWPDASGAGRYHRELLAVRRPDRTPSSKGIVHLFEEVVFGEGEKVLRQGLTGSGFYVILDGEAAVVVDGTERARLGSRRVLRRGLDHPRRVADRRRRGDPAAALPRPRRPARRGVPHRPPAGHVPDAPGAGAPAARREPMAELSTPDAPFPPGDYPVLVVGSGPGALQVSYSLRAARASSTRSSRPTRRPAGCSAAGRSSSASCRGPSRTRRPRAGTPRVRALRLEQPARRRAGTAARSSRAHGRHVVLPVAARDGGEPRRVRRARRRSPSATAAAGPARAGSRLPMATGSRSRRPTASYRCRVLVVAVGVAEPFTPPGVGDGVHPPLRRCPPGRDVRRSPRPHHRQAELRVRARDRAAAVGQPADPDVSPSKVAPVGRDARRSSASGPATSSRTRTTSSVAASASSTRRSTGSSRPADGRLTVHLRRTDGGADLAVEVDDVDLGDRVRDAAAGPPRARGHDLRREPPAGPDAVVGERDGPGHLLRRDDRPGRQGPPEARRAVELRGGPRRALQRHGSSPARSPRRTSGSSRSGRTWRRDAMRASSPPSCAEAPGALPPARLPRPGPHRRPGRRSATTASSRWPTCSTPAGRTRSPRPSRPTAPGRSTRSSTRRIGGTVVEQAIETDPFMHFDSPRRGGHRRAGRAGEAH